MRYEARVFAAVDGIMTLATALSFTFAGFLVQAIGLGLLSSLADAREVVRRSFEVRAYDPKSPESWQEPYARFLNCLAASGA